METTVAAFSNQPWCEPKCAEQGPGGTALPGIEKGEAAGCTGAMRAPRRHKSPGLVWANSSAHGSEIRTL